VYLTHPRTNITRTRVPSRKPKNRLLPFLGAIRTAYRKKKTLKLLGAVRQGGVPRKKAPKLPEDSPLTKTPKKKQRASTERRTGGKSFKGPHRGIL